MTHCHKIFEQIGKSWSSSVQALKFCKRQAVIHSLFIDFELKTLTENDNIPITNT